LCTLPALNSVPIYSGRQSLWSVDFVNSGYFFGSMPAVYIT